MAHKVSSIGDYFYTGFIKLHNQIITLKVYLSTKDINMCKASKCFVSY